MNKLIWICFEDKIAEVIVSDLTAKQLEKYVEIIEVETVKSRPLSFRVVSDKFLCRWLSLDYKQLKAKILE